MSYTGKMQSKFIEFRRQAWSFIRLTRIQFLLGGLLLYALGAAIAASMGVAINWPAYLLGQGMVISIQLMAQYLNEYYDVPVDGLLENNRTWFSGGSGILPAGDVSTSSVLAAIRICAGVAIFTGILASSESLWMIPIFLLCFIGSWFYSAPPFSLMSSGWGELTTSVIVALLVPMAGYCLQNGFPPFELWLVCIPLVLVHLAMLLSFEFPDRAVDLAVGKKTLTVRLGIRGASKLGNSLIGLAYLFLVVLLFVTGYPVLWMVAAIPLAIWQMVMLGRVILPLTRSYFRFLTLGGVGLFALMALLLLLEFIFKPVASF